MNWRGRSSHSPRGVLDVQVATPETSPAGHPDVTGRTPDRVSVRGVPVLAAPYCVTRVVDVPLAVALAALDSRIAPSAGEPQLELAGIGWRLSLRPPGRGPWGEAGAHGRSLPGVLRAGLWRQRIEVQVSPWSSEQVRMALRARSFGYRRPVRALVVAAEEALLRLDAVMRAFSEEPLRRLFADGTAHGRVGDPVAPGAAAGDSAPPRPRSRQPRP